MGDISPQRRYSCCLMVAVFGRRKPVLDNLASSANNGEKSPETNSPAKRLRGGPEDAVASVGTASLKATNSSCRSNSNSKPIHKPNLVVNQNNQRNYPRQTAIRTSRVSPVEGYVNQGRRVPKDAVGISGELESMIADHQKSKGGRALVRASSSNVMLAGNLGNLRQVGNTTNSHNIVDYNANQREQKPVDNGRYTNNKVEDKDRSNKEQPSSLCRALSTRMDPEQLKIMGNEDYKNGRFAEALALYDAAIAIDPDKASYRSNRSAALTALGRILEALFECREAIRKEPHYHRAHHRLGNLYTRLGDIDKALYHHKHAGPETDPDEIAKLKKLQVHLNKCTEARRVGNWINLIKETNNVISSGADSAPQIFALQAEAFLKLGRHEDAEEVMSRGPKFDVDECTKFFGPIGNANLLVTRAKVDLVAGRFEDALDAVQKAARLDPNNKEANKVTSKARAMASARLNGNNLFKASKFSEACAVYGEGLEHDPCNSILLCNRAACRSKLGQFEKAIEDCTSALNLRPSYSKARLRRANCNAKLERWEASIQDYEILLRETPQDEEVSKALLEVKEQLSKR